MKGLRATRLEKGLSLRQMAALCTVTIATFSHIERGLKVPWYETRQAIERILGKINWLDTANINITPIQSDWEQTERDFRSLINRIASLPDEQKQAFVKSSIKHLKVLTK